tara:strand:+ start:3409 stop:3537 length:129 start_codon:yes stop_codon:yes gene_type:complete
MSGTNRSGLQPQGVKKTLKEFYDAFKSSGDSYKKYMGTTKKK